MKQDTQLLLRDNPEGPTGSPTVPRGQREQGRSHGKGEDGRPGSHCGEPRSAPPLIPHPSSPLWGPLSAPTPHAPSSGSCPPATEEGLGAPSGQN